MEGREEGGKIEWLTEERKEEKEEEEEERDELENGTVRMFIKRKSGWISSFNVSNASDTHTHTHTHTRVYNYNRRHALSKPFLQSSSISFHTANLLSFYIHAHTTPCPTQHTHLKLHLPNQGVRNDNNNQVYL